MRNLILIFASAFVLYFGAWFAVYSLRLNTLAIQSEDTVPAILVPLTILKHNSLFLDDYVPMMLQKYPHPDDKKYLKGLLPFYLRKVDNHYVSAFPIITPILALPVYFPFVAFNIPVTWENLAMVSHIASALIVAVSGAFLYYLLRKTLELAESTSRILTICYLFGTINFALVAQSLWQHGTLQLFSIIALIFFVKAFKEDFKQSAGSYIFWFSFFSGIAVLSRPTAALPYVIFSLYIVKRNWKATLPLILGMSPCVLFFVWYNAVFYHSISNQGYSNQIFKNWLGGFPLSFFGIWISPSKGILVYSPIFIFSFLGFITALKNKARYTNLFLLAATSAFLHILIISFWKHWFGGWSFGYRMSSDVIPYLILLLVPFVESTFFKKYSRTFYVLLVISIFIEIVGVVFFDGVWHAAYDKGFKNTAWLWSLKDSEMVFYLRRVLVKVGVLKNPFSF